MSPSLLESDIKNDIQSQFTSCTEVTRFMKNGNPMPLVKVTFADSLDVTQILANGVYIGSLFNRPESYIPIKRPTRCFNCNCYGHTANLCKQKSVCCKCSGHHKSSSCTSDIIKCANCKGNHTAYDKTCPIYLDHVAKCNQVF